MELRGGYTLTGSGTVIVYEVELIQAFIKEDLTTNTHNDSEVDHENDKTPTIPA